MYNRTKKFQAITDKMLDIYIKKNADYGNSVADTYDIFGLDSFLVRMYDKLNRAIQLNKNDHEQQVKDEKIEDTLLDLANYTIMALIEMDREKYEKLKIINSNETKVVSEKDIIEY